MISDKSPAQLYVIPIEIMIVNMDFIDRFKTKIYRLAMVVLAN